MSDTLPKALSLRAASETDYEYLPDLKCKNFPHKKISCQATIYGIITQPHIIASDSLLNLILNTFL